MKYPNFIPPSKLGVVIHSDDEETLSVALIHSSSIVINIQSGEISMNDGAKFDKFVTPNNVKLYPYDLISYIDGRPNLENLKPWIHEVKDALEN